VDRTLTELELNQLPRLLVFNKSDLIDKETVIAVQREIALQSGTDSLAISAMNPSTLQPLLRRIEAATASASHFSEFRQELSVGGG
jgi:50S ribosomal subunit-associated GTPase HflX